VRAKSLVHTLLRDGPHPESTPPVAAPPGHIVVRSLEELDERIDFLEHAWAVSDDELRRGFGTFRMEVEQPLPDDPFSDEYRQAVLDLYAWLHGAQYSPTNEYMLFDFDYCVNAPFPYSTQSGITVGDHLIAVGHVIRTMNLAPHSRVLEFGAGWGNTTLVLAQMGHHVTAVDVGQNFVDLINARAARLERQVETVVGDFSVIDGLAGGYDAVLFFESFHHCADHLRLLAGLDRVVAPGGRVLFAAEAVYETWPVPWGLRFDAESVWAIRKRGWLELGFRRSYFLEALARFGWKADQVSCPETNAGEIYVARRVSED
jgi:2-polyprenyl-3-methyl-5-hydroxy-6-metoxy-1,4-benzoquinol methylase